MSLIVATLKDDLLSAFQSMNNGDNTVFSQKISAAVDKYAESGSIATTDAGAIPAGAFTGAGVGKIACDASICEKIIIAACNAMNTMREGGDVYLAAQLALGIHSMVSAGKVETDVTGVVVPPGSSPVPMNGKATGAMTGVPAPMQAAFLAAFNAMGGMTSGGDSYMAQQMAAAVDAYLKAAAVNTQGTGPLAGSVGAGKMT
jgi:hypothetical protein